ncbi:MAG TPA: glucose/galactose MFS transporter, partial [Candidatus Coprenecus merdipullorum]|nr:glucose/galactose MFS transporter [Candidatus Coprenecus merdipullorum]
LLYVAAQTGINSFFINYVMEASPGIAARTAALMLSFGGMGLFMVGRILGSVVMRSVRPAVMMTVCSSGAVICMTVVTLCSGTAGITALCLTYLFESVMFPTIFSMALSGIHGEQTKTASSYLVMSIVGGAVAPVLMGIIGESSMAVGFVLPLMCFTAITAYSILSCRKFRTITD